MVQPLSSNPYPPGSDNFTAYERCTALERIVEFSVDEKGFTSQLCGRILGFMMQEAPTEAGRNNIQREIGACTDNEGLMALGRHHIMFLFTFYRRAHDHTPTTSYFPPQDTLGDHEDAVAGQLAEASTSNEKAKQSALIRDDHRCAVTRAYDLETFFAQRKIDPTFPLPGGIASTVVAHILPDSFNQGLTWKDDEEPGKKLDGSATGWAVVERFGQIDRISDLQCLGSHRIENVMTMCRSVHSLFDELQLWFEATGTLNTYRTCSTEQDALLFFAPPIPATVTFSSTDPENLPVPHPAFLLMHAACARVAHLSGAVEYFETIMEKWEDGLVLETDGTSGDMLGFMLERLAHHSN